MSKVLEVRTDGRKNAYAPAVLDAGGLTVGEAGRGPFRRLIDKQVLPLKRKAPNAETGATAEAARR